MWNPANEAAIVCILWFLVSHNIIIYSANNVIRSVSQLPLLCLGLSKAHDSVAAKLNN